MRLMISCDVLFWPINPEESVGIGAAKMLPFARAWFDDCEPLNLLLNAPETKLDCPVLLLDCRGIDFQSIAITPQLIGVCPPLLNEKH